MLTSSAPLASPGGVRKAIFSVASRGTVSPPGETVTAGGGSGAGDGDGATVAVAARVGEAVAVVEGEAPAVGEGEAPTVAVGEGEATAPLEPSRQPARARPGRLGVRREWP